MENKEIAKTRILMSAIFLAIIIGVYVADSYLIRMEAARMPEVFADHEFLDHPFKKNFNYFAAMPGGDLVTPPNAIKYGRPKNIHIITDSYGFMTPADTTLDSCSTIITGDSFTQGLDNRSTVAAILTNNFGIPTYNMGFAGYPQNSVLSFLRKFRPSDDSASKVNSAPERTLILILDKRNLTHLFASELHYVMTVTEKKIKKKMKQRAAFNYFPHNIVKYRKRHSFIIDKLTPYLIPVNRLMGKTVSENYYVGKNNILFLKDDVNFGRPPVNDESIDFFAGVMAILNDAAAARGFSLLVVIVPDKSDIYPNLLPEDLRAAHTNYAEIHFEKVANAVESKNVEIINMLPALKDAAAKNPSELLFHEDDSHWNINGMRIAADQISASLDR